MFRRSNTPTDDTHPHGRRDAPRGRARRSGRRQTRPTRGYRDGVDPAAAQEARKERFGGLNAGAAFFGWLVAIAVSVLLTGIIGAIAAAVGSNAQVTQADATANAGNIGLVAAIVLLVVLMIGYYCGGYVAGRMSRFYGTSQGLGVWITGFVVTIADDRAGRHLRPAVRHPRRG